MGLSLGAKNRILAFLRFWQDVGATEAETALKTEALFSKVLEETQSAQVCKFLMLSACVEEEAEEPASKPIP